MDLNHSIIYDHWVTTPSYKLLLSRLQAECALQIDQIAAIAASNYADRLQHLQTVAVKLHTLRQVITMLQDKSQFLQDTTTRANNDN